MRSTKHSLLLIALCVAFQILLAFALSHTYLLYRNTLHNNASWISTKMTVEKHLMGSRSFFFGTQALAKGHLNLGAWHGFQEVLYRDRLHVKDLEFDLWLEPKSYLNIVFNKTDAGFSCVRLSVNEDFESSHLVVAAGGRFLKRTEVDAAVLRPRHWHHAALRFDDDTVSLFLDDKDIGIVREHIVQPQHIGFRGGHHNAVVDNVLVNQHGSERVFESFSNSRGALRVMAFCVLLVGVSNASIFLLLRYAYRIRDKRTGFYLAMFNMVLIIFSVLIFGFQYMTGDCYTRAHKNARDAERRWKAALAEDVARDVRDAYGTMPEAGVYRMLFIGTSQTWGAGASKPSATFVRNIEKKLNQSGIHKGQFECINAGISALNSSRLLDLYRKEWLELGPRMVIINLSNNDGDIDKFASNLQDMIEISVEAGIQPVLVLEANPAENTRRRLSKKHEAMRQVAEAHNVPVVDMHAYLGRKYDEGFLWWDGVHLTDFGHQLLADELHRELLQIMKNDL